MAQLPQTSALVLEQTAGVLRIWLNRPEAKNSLNAAMVDELHAVLDAVRDDRDIRCLILRGKGGIFCAGADLKNTKADSQDAEATHADVARGNRSFGDLLIKLNEQPQVVIMQVEGAAIGGGLGLCCVADVTIVAADTKFRLSETSLGIPPAQIAPFVTERIGLTQARRLMLTGARFDGTEAVRVGIGHFVVPDNDAMTATCEAVLADIRQCAPGANAVTKGIVFTATRQPRDVALDFAAEGFADCMLGDEGREGITAFIERRKPYWAQD